MKDEAKKALEQWVGEMKDPNSQASKNFEKHIEDLIQQEKQLQVDIENLYNKICSYEDFEDFMFWLSEKYSQKSKEASESGTYIDSIDEQWILVEVAEKYGRELTSEEFNKINNPFLSVAYYFKGYVFGIMYGQGSCPWYVKWDTSIFGPEQLNLI